MQFLPGAKVWFHCGGYGYDVDVPALVVRNTRARVVIELDLTAVPPMPPWPQRSRKQIAVLGANLRPRGGEAPPEAR